LHTTLYNAIANHPYHAYMYMFNADTAFYSLSVAMRVNKCVLANYIF